MGCFFLPPVLSLIGTVDGEELTLELDEWGEVSGGEMGDDAVNRGIATLERAKRLHDAGNKEDAVLGYKVSCVLYSSL